MFSLGRYTTRSGNCVASAPVGNEQQGYPTRMVHVTPEEEQREPSVSSEVDESTRMERTIMLKYLAPGHQQYAQTRIEGAL